MKLSEIVSFTTKAVQSYEKRSDEHLLFSLASMAHLLRMGPFMAMFSLTLLFLL